MNKARLFLLLLCIQTLIFSSIVRISPAQSEEEEAIRTTIERWLEAWQNQDLAIYMSFYHPLFFSGALDREGWEAKKERIFSLTSDVGIQISDLTISVNPEDETAVARFLQDYRSDTLSDFGEKTLILLREETWRIQSESWKPVPEDLSDRNFDAESEPLDSALKTQEDELDRPFEEISESAPEGKAIMDTFEEIVTDESPAALIEGFPVEMISQPPSQPTDTEPGYARRHPPSFPEFNSALLENTLFLPDEMEIIYAYCGPSLHHFTPSVPGCLIKILMYVPEPFLLHIPDLLPDYFAFQLADLEEGDSVRVYRAELQKQVYRYPSEEYNLRGFVYIEATLSSARGSTMPAGIDAIQGKAMRVTASSTLNPRNEFASSGWFPVPGNCCTQGSFEWNLRNRDWPVILWPQTVEQDCYKQDKFKEWISQELSSVQGLQIDALRYYATKTHTKGFELLAFGRGKKGSSRNTSDAYIYCIKQYTVTNDATSETGYSYLQTGLQGCDTDLGPTRYKIAVGNYGGFENLHYLGSD